MLTEEEKDLILRGIWNGRITDRRLPEILYVDTGNDLHDAWIEGFEEENQTLDPELLAIFALGVDLNQNVYRFSSAKTFQQVKEMSNFIVDAEGNIRSFNSFKNLVDPIYDQFNVQWLRTEFDTAVSQAQSAAQWQQIQDTKDILPLLQYVTAGDSKVRALHASWDGIVRPVDDSFWDTHMPPCDFNCRCGTLQLEAGEQRLSPLRGVKPNDSTLFNTNPGKERLIFKEEGRDAHPYFKVQREDQLFKSRNFDLPLPDGADSL